MELLTKKKIHEISVKELRKMAEIHRTTFYRHYQTPHDVLLEVEYDSIKGFQNTSGPLNDIADLKEHAARMCSYQTLLELRYLCFKSWEQIAVLMNYNCNYVFDLHKRALKAIVVPQTSEEN